jgi:hypothetical protein
MPEHALGAGDVVDGAAGVADLVVEQEVGSSKGAEDSSATLVSLSR